jgi:hypothetical protein
MYKRGPTEINIDTNNDRPDDIVLKFNVDNYDKALELAGQFLRTRQNVDGSVNGADTLYGYYTQPVAFLGTGSTTDWSYANRCIDYVKRNFLMSNGSLKVASPHFVGDFYPYAWLIRGASLWERFDVAGPVIRYMLKYQDRDSGGVFYRRKNRRLIDPSVTANGGIGMILNGYLKEAEMAGCFFIKLHDSQPDPEKRYLTVWDAKKNEYLTNYDNIKDVPWGEGSILDRERKYDPNTKGIGANAYWDSGFIMGFMTYLYYTTGDNEYLRIAEEHFDLVSNYKHFFTNVMKTPWACARLYQATGRQRYLDAATSMADQICSMQQHDGGFFLGRKSSYSELQSDVASLIDSSSQLTHYLSQVRAVL